MTSHVFVFVSLLLKGRVWWPYPLYSARSDSLWLSIVIKHGTYSSCWKFLLPIPNALFTAHMKTPRPVTCVSFRDTMDLVQTFEGVTLDKTVSVSNLERNRKYPILRAKRFTPRIVPAVVLSGTHWKTLLRSCCRKDTVTSWRTMILWKSIPMLCPSISSTEASVQQRKPSS